MARDRQRRLTSPAYSKDFTSSRIHEWDALKMYAGVPCRFLEIGVFEGRTSRWFLENILTHSASKLVGVDPYTPESLGLDRHTAPKDAEALDSAKSGVMDLALQTHKFQIHQGRSPEALREFPLEYFDVVYIDGDHRAFSCLQDMVAAWGVLRTTGILMLDDYSHDWAKNERPTVGCPRDAVDAFLRCQPPHKVLWTAYTIGIQKLHDDRKAL